MWKEFFGEKSQIIGLDINPNCKKHEEDRIDIFIGSQDDPIILNEILNKYQKIDIVIDDGSHIGKHMAASFNHLYYKISSNGIYLVEDIHTCFHHHDFYNKNLNFMDFIKNKLDELHGCYNKKITDFTKITDSINIYNNIVIFEKRIQGNKIDIKTVKMT
jgi:hypothetical protein